MVAAMDSARRTRMLAAMAGKTPEAESVSSVSKHVLPLETPGTRTTPPFVASVSMFPAENTNPAAMPLPEIPGWDDPDPVMTDPDFLEAPAVADNPVSLETLETWKQTADSCGSQVFPCENPAGNAGNKPLDLADPAALAILEAPELVGRAELLYGGKVEIGADGPVWRGRRVDPPAEVLAVLKDRRLAVQAVLLARTHAAKTRTREPDSWSADDWLAYFHERAGIREFDAGPPRLEAARLAMADCVEHWQRRNSPAPHGPENGCWQCGHAGTDAGGADPLTSRCCRGGVFWIHPRCWADYDASADAAAHVALKPIIRGAS
jgi:hypothetical protein